MNLGVFLKEFWDTVALQFFELVEQFLPKPPCRLLIHRLLQLACPAAPHPIGLRATTLLHLHNESAKKFFGNSLSHAGHCMAERKAIKKFSNCPKLQCRKMMTVESVMCLSG